MFEEEMDFLEKNFQDKLIIVEGIKDKKVLEDIGISKIIDISGKSLFAIPEIISQDSPQIVVLTDYDEEGEAKASLLTKLLIKNDLSINQFLRNKFKSLFKIQKIEELVSITKFMEDDYNGKTSPINDKIFNRSRIFHRRNSRKT